MKYIKMVLISFLVFFILFTLIGLLFPSSTKAVKAIVVNKNRELVLKELRVSDNWLKWYPFFQSATGAHINDPVYVRRGQHPVALRWIRFYAWRLRRQLLSLCRATAATPAVHG